MSYPYGAPGGYPPQGGYPQQGFPPQQGYPGYPAQSGMPEPFGNSPYPAQPTNIGFQQPQQYPPASGGMPSAYGQQPGGGYPPAGAGGHYQAPGSYPGQQTYPPAGQQTYPPASGGAYPPAAGGAYPPAAGGAYPPAAGGAYPPGAGGVYPPAAGGAYPPAASGAYPPATGGWQGMPAGGAAYNTAVPSASGMTYSQPAVQERGTIRAAPSFNAEEDSKVLRKAMKGLGTDEKAIIDLLTLRSNAQRQEIKNRFKTMYGKDLIKDLKSELSGRFEDVIVALMVPPIEYDADQLRNAMQGAGTNESTLIEILCTRSNRQMQEIKATYKMKYHRDLEKDLMSETSGHFRRLVVALSTGNRMDNQPIDIEKARRDAMELYQAGEKMLGTDESKFNQILCSQGFDQLRLVFLEYRKIASKGLDQAIRSEMSGDLEKGMLAIVSVVENKYHFFAEKLYHSMKGAGTKDEALIRVVVTRCEVDMVQIKQEFQRLYGKTLESFIQEDTSGDYQRVLLALVRGY